MVAKSSRVKKAPAPLYRIGIEPAPLVPREPEYCHRCDGHGWTWYDGPYRKPAPDDQSDPDIVDCEACDGSGVVACVHEQPIWAYWSTTQCGVDASVKAHRETGTVRLTPSSCRVNGCRRCHANRRRSALEGLTGLRAAPGKAWYMWTMTPKTRITTWEERDEWIATLRKDMQFLKNWGYIDGAYVITEATEAIQYIKNGKVVDKTTRGAVAQSAPYSRQTCPARLKWWEGREGCAGAVGPQWEAECLAGDCPLCGGRGFLPIAHLHAHILVVGDPFWYGRDGLDVAAAHRDPKEAKKAQWAISKGIRDFPARPDTIADHVIASGGVGRAYTDGAGRRRYTGDTPTCVACRGTGGDWQAQKCSHCEGYCRFNKGCDRDHGACQACDGTGEMEMRSGMRGVLESWGWTVFDFKPIKTPEAVSAYVSKIVKWYASKVAESEHGALLLGAWMAGRRSTWAVGELFGLASARRRALGYDSLGLKRDDVGPTWVKDLGTAKIRGVSWMGDEPKNVKTAYIQVRRATKRWKQLVNGELFSLVFPVGLKSADDPQTLLSITAAGAVDDEGTVRIIGDGILATVLVGGALIGRPGVRETAVGAVARAYHRWTREKFKGNWWDWWKVSAARLGIPTPRAVRHVQVRRYATRRGKRVRVWKQVEFKPGDSRTFVAESGRDKTWKSRKVRLVAPRAIGARTTFQHDEVTGVQDGLFGGMTTYVTKPKAVGRSRQAEIREVTAGCEAFVPMGGHLELPKRPNMEQCLLYADRMVTDAGWPVSGKDDRAHQPWQYDYSLLGLME